jgi:hypothetical protein
LYWLFSYAVTSLAWYILLAWLCIVVYRSLRLPALPWIASRYVLAFFAWLATGYLYRRLWPSGVTPIGRPLTPDEWLPLWEMVVAVLCDLLVAVLAFSEVAFLISRAFPDVRSRLLTFLLRARHRTRAIGISACILTVISPLIYLIVYFIHGPFAHNT